MYIFGGRGDLSGPYHTSNEVYCNKIQVFNTLTGMWHEPVTTGNAPPGRRSHSACEYMGILLISTSIIFTVSGHNVPLF